MRKEEQRDRQTDRHDKANRHFSQLWERFQKFLSVYVYVIFKEAVTNCGRTASMQVVISKQSASEVWWHTRRKQISSFGETDKSI
jgi:hypothetical protein